MTRATILPAPAGPLTLADRYEQAARAVEAYIAARRALSVAALGKGSLTPVIEALTLMRAITKARKHLERWQTACPGSDDENTAGSSALEVLYRAERRAARALVAKRGGA
ncbi:MAG TPA: hypothetical protein VLT47_11155 [Anaeromyxobacteraceae bacterium]|nr:hypothetical protein [Anaeromyxobacteraceae bacterium]